MRGVPKPAPTRMKKYFSREKDGWKLPSVSGRWCSEPPCYGAVIKMPRRSFRHGVVPRGMLGESFGE